MNIFKSLKTILFLILILLFLVYLEKNIIAGNTTSDIIINEILFDPEGTDSGKEWVELYNKGTQSINTTNWKILVAGTSFIEVSTFSGLIQPQQYYLICEVNVTDCNVNISKIAMQNGGGATDAIRIVDSNNQIVDEIFYDNPNLSNLKDRSGTIVSQGADIGISGESLGRKDLVSTNNSYDDFYIFSSPTPGEENTGNLIEEEIPQTGNSPLLFITILLIIIFSGILIINNKLYSKKYV